MPNTVNLEPAKPPEIGVVLRVADIGDADLINSIPELEADLKARYPKVRAVDVTHHNPRTETPSTETPSTQNWCLFDLHYETWILIMLANPFAHKIMSDVADDAYKWLKKRFKVKKYHARRVRKRPRAK